MASRSSDFYRTRAALSSPNHPSRLERWIRQALEADPALTDEQAVRAGELLRREHYASMARLSAQVRRRPREADPAPVDEEAVRAARLRLAAQVRTEVLTAPERA